MALTIDASVGGASANSYVTLAEATTYFEGRLNATAFTGASTDDQNRALAEATRELSAAMWMGRRVDDTQALSWPRQWAVDPDSPTSDYYSTTVIPERIKRATHELALEFLRKGTTDIAALDTTLQTQSTEVGGAIKRQYVEPWARVRGLRRFPQVMREIGVLLEGQGVSTAVVRA